ncbi:hypothetical protein DL546_007406 [Coniochaeta pulveracea]|uniref:Uncharacterized protein n=1 Tax=Coniochaeta pulveracea TaxID=177199 RepID=A0A420YAM7_9PEZI|nr:hypothetical protein DL546_007406 [Coniochaeta pulveracea]
MATTSNAEQQPRRRFAPVPIETTFEQFRKNADQDRPGPVAEPTPSPSPRSDSPPPRFPEGWAAPPTGLHDVQTKHAHPHKVPREKRRFAPQLVESSVRRSRRAGDEGPATRPTDRTDITPYTNHIYAPKARRRHGQSRADEERRAALARRESQDDEVAGPVFGWSAKDAQRVQKTVEEAALVVFPNYARRTGGAEHFYVHEGSSSEHDSDTIPSPIRGRSMFRTPGHPKAIRRNSSAEDVNWAFKEMQEHATRREKAQEQQRRPSHLGPRLERVASFGSPLERLSSYDLDNMSFDSPPNDAMGLTQSQRQSISGSPSWARRYSGPLDVIGEHTMSYIPPEPLPTIGEQQHYMPFLPSESDSSPPVRPIGESFMPYIPAAPPGKAADMGYAAPSQIPPDTSFGHTPAFSDFPSPSKERDPSLERLRNAHKVRKNPPPMLGADLEFRRCPSPKQTKMEPDHLWDLERGARAEEPNRDTTVHRPAMITTPLPPATPGDPFARAFSMSEIPEAMPEEPEAHRLHTSSAKQTLAPSQLVRKKEHERSGLRLLQGLDERLAKEKEAAELEERIAAEFDDHFVTQVYNYLSLGYPAMARSYDEELSKISQVPIEQLRKEDDAIMDHLWGIEPGETNDGVVVDGVSDTGKKQPARKAKVTGHIMLDSEEHDGVREEDRCPRWKALKKYIYEWARQHPDLDAISPLAWGMQERRGSWRN